jgi:EAL domain-containing protein (putative c-di-GMP-specific phosphodiesterase class I)
MQVSGQDLTLHASIGIACYPQDGENERALLYNADTALHHAKEEGRNCFRFFSAEQNALALEALRLRNNLALALARKEFSLNYQPRIEAASGRVTGFEALIRWRHPDLGLVPPAKFIPVAEQTGMIESIGEWVLGTACAQHHAWLAKSDRPMRLAVNLSLRQLRQRDLCERIRDLLQDNHLEPHALELEVTESFVMEDAARSVQVLSELRRLGISIALDDFGTEYSSLGYLKRIPLDFMKIDQSFVRGLPNDQDDVAIIKTIVNLARDLGLKVIAEGAETKEQLAFLRDLGCDEIQGYVVSKPLGAENVEGFLRRHGELGGR